MAVPFKEFVKAEEQMQIKNNPPSPKIIDEKAQWTDTGNATLLCQLFGENIRFVPEWKSWMHWTGTHWKKCKPGRQGYPAVLVRYAQNTAKYLLSYADKIDEEKQREASRQYAISCESWVKIKSMISLAEAGDGITVSADMFDSNNFLFNTANGTLDLENPDKIEFYPHRREDYITQVSPTPYLPDEKYHGSRWESFLNRIMRSNPELIPYLQNLAGQLLTGEVREKAFWIFWGSKGDNGKTTFIEALQYVLNEFAQTVPINALIKENKGNIPVDLESLRSARFVFAAEPDIGDELTPGLIKRITGKDMMKTRALHEMPTQWHVKFKLVIATNNQPQIDDPSNAMWIRVKCVPFLEKIPLEEQDRTLGEKLKSEGSIILNWMIEGCQLWLKYGMKEPEIITKTTKEYREDSDKLGEYINYCLIESPTTGFLPSEIAYKLYHLWCENNHQFPYAFNKFSTMMKDRGYELERGFWTDKNGQKTRARGLIGLTTQDWLTSGISELMEQYDNDMTTAKWIFGEHAREKTKEMAQCNSISRAKETLSEDKFTINSALKNELAKEFGADKPTAHEVDAYLKIYHEDDLNDDDRAKIVATYCTPVQEDDVMFVGMGKAQRERLGVLRDIIRSSQNGSGGVELDTIVSKASAYGITKDDTGDMLCKLKSAGEVIEVSQDKYRVV